MPMKVEGLREIEAALKDLTRATARNVAKRTLAKAAEPLMLRAREKAPRGETGNLIRGIISSPLVQGANAGAGAWGRAMRAGLGKEAAVMAARNMNRGQKVDTVFHYVGMHVNVGQGLLQEFGTVKFPAQPFLRPAYLQTQTDMLNIIKTELAAEVAKSLARAARRRAKAGG